MITLTAVGRELGALGERAVIFVVSGWLAPDCLYVSLILPHSSPSPPCSPQSPGGDRTIVIIVIPHMGAALHSLYIASSTQSEQFSTGKAVVMCSFRFTAKKQSWRSSRICSVLRGQKVWPLLIPGKPRLSPCASVLRRGQE